MRLTANAAHAVGAWARVSQYRGGSLFLSEWVWAKGRAETTGYHRSVLYSCCRQTERKKADFLLFLFGSLRFGRATTVGPASDILVFFSSLVASWGFWLR